MIGVGVASPDRKPSFFKGFEGTPIPAPPPIMPAKRLSLRDDFRDEYIREMRAKRAMMAG